MTFFKKIDLRDVFLFVGLALVGVGLFMLAPWLAFTVCGVLLMAIGLLIGAK